MWVEVSNQPNLVAMHSKISSSATFTNVWLLYYTCSCFQNLEVYKLRRVKLINKTSTFKANFIDNIHLMFNNVPRCHGRQTSCYNYLIAMVYPKLVLSQITPVSIRQQLLETGMDMKA